MTAKATETPSLLDQADPPVSLNEIDQPPNPSLATSRWKPADGEIPPHIEIRMKEGKQWDRFLNLRAVTKQNRECSFTEASQIAYEIVLRARSRYDVYLTKAELLKREEKAREQAQRKADREAARTKKKEPDPEVEPPPEKGSESIWLIEKRRAGQLIHKGHIAGSHSTPRKIVEWVFQHLYVDGVMPADAPSAGAWGLLCFARANADNESELIQMWSKLLPTKAELERGDKQQDDGRDVIDTIHRIRAKLQEPPPVVDIETTDDLVTA